MKDNIKTILLAGATFIFGVLLTLTLLGVVVPLPSMVCLCVSCWIAELPPGAIAVVLGVTAFVFLSLLVKLFSKGQP